MVTPSADTEQAPIVVEFSALFSQHFRYLWCTLRRLGIHEGDLEDVAHEVLLRIHAQLSLRDPEKPIRPWIFGMALGAAANYRRLARHRIAQRTEPEELADPQTAADDALIASERCAAVQRALQRVPLQHRAVVILHDMDEIAVPEIAAAIGIGVNTAYSRLRLGREAFRCALEQIMVRGGSK
jgi:RNA polymerase sigma-70 factor, ECF subfamily